MNDLGGGNGFDFYYYYVCIIIVMAYYYSIVSREGRWWPLDKIPGGVCFIGNGWKGRIGVDTRKRL